MRNILLLLLSVLLILPACKNSHVAHSGIQKRKYTKGYHLSFGKHKKQQLKKAAKPVTRLEKSTPPTAKKPLLASLQEEEVPEMPAPQEQARPAPPGKKQTKKQALEPIVKRYHKTEPQPAPAYGGDQLAMLAFVFVMAGIIFFPLLLVGFIMSIVALARISRDDQNYGLALAAFIVGLVYMILVVFLIILLIAWF